MAMSAPKAAAPAAPSDDAVVVEDTPAPVAGEENSHLKRTLRLSSKAAPGNLYFRIAQGGFEEKDGSFLRNELAITVKGANPFVEGGDLRDPISFKNGSAEFEVTYEWVN